MLRKTEIEIHDTEVEVIYSIDHGYCQSASILVNGLRREANWLLEIPSVRESLEDHHANLLDEENIDV